MSLNDRESRESGVQSRRKAAGRSSNRKTPHKEAEQPHGVVVSASIEDAELTAAEERWNSLWTSDAAPGCELEDGTNLPAGTNYSWQLWKSKSWFKPSETVVNPNWKQTLQRIQRRMEALQSSGKKFPVSLVQVQLPNSGQPKGTPAGFKYPSSHGLRLEPVSLEPHSFVVPEFAFEDVKTSPIKNSAGDPFPFRLGFARKHYLKQASLEDLQLFSDAAKVLIVLPVFVNEIVWKRWRQGFPLPKEGFEEGVWIDAVFEIAWQQLPFSSLRATRKGLSSDGKSSAVLKGEGLFPRIPPAFRSIVPNVHGYPQRIFSELPDLLESSLQLIETMLAIPEPVSEKSEPVTETPEAVQKTKDPTVTVDAVCSKLCRQKNSRKTLKTILTAAKRGDRPSEIATNHRGKKGFSLSNISEQLTKVREQFPGFLPE